MGQPRHRFPVPYPGVIMDSIHPILWIIPAILATFTVAFLIYNWRLTRIDNSWEAGKIFASGQYIDRADKRIEARILHDDGRISIAIGIRDWPALDSDWEADWISAHTGFQTVIEAVQYVRGYWPESTIIECHANNRGTRIQGHRDGRGLWIRPGWESPE